MTVPLLMRFILKVSQCEWGCSWGSIATQVKLIDTDDYLWITNQDNDRI